MPITPIRKVWGLLAFTVFYFGIRDNWFAFRHEAYMDIIRQCAGKMNWSIERKMNKNNHTEYHNKIICHIPCNSTLICYTKNRRKIQEAFDMGIEENLSFCSLMLYPSKYSAKKIIKILLQHLSPICLKFHATALIQYISTM